MAGKCIKCVKCGEHPQEFEVPDLWCIVCWVDWMYEPEEGLDNPYTEEYLRKMKQEDFLSSREMFPFPATADWTVEEENQLRKHFGLPPLPPDQTDDQH